VQQGHVAIDVNGRLRAILAHLGIPTSNAGRKEFARAIGVAVFGRPMKRDSRMKQHILLTVALLGACGGDGPDTKPGTVNAQSARASVEGMSDISQAFDNANGSSAASAVIALTAVGQTLVIPGTAHEVPASAVLPVQWPKSNTESFTGSAECNASGCVFRDFGDTGTWGSYRINGTISRSGDRYTFDLTYDITGQGLDFHWEMDGDIRVTPALIDGSVSSRGDARVESEGERYDLSWDFDIDYNAIGLDGSGCPVSGSLAATVEVSGSGPSGGGSYRTAGSVTFGPSCGQVRSN
jgi:hypothetical protein